MRSVSVSQTGNMIAAANDKVEIVMNKTLLFRDNCIFGLSVTTTRILDTLNAHIKYMIPLSLVAYSVQIHSISMI